MTNRDDHGVATSHPGGHAQHQFPSAHPDTHPHGEHHGHDNHTGHTGHSGHGGDHVAQFRKLFWINLIIAIPVVAFSTMFAMLLGYDVPDFPGAGAVCRADTADGIGRLLGDV